MQNIILQKRIVKKLIYLLVLVVFALGSYFYDQIKSHYDAKVPQEVVTIQNSNLILDKNIYLIGNYTVDYITDGDTVHAKDSNGKEEKIRFLAVNTPEIHNAASRELCLGKLAKEFTKENLLNKQVVLYGDTTQPKRDKYDRLLAYVQVLEANATGTPFFNEMLMKKGYSKVYKASPVATYYAKYLGYQAEAQKENLIMWNTQLCN